jgi:tetratricopeptide (TPR) repeat protein
MDSDITQSARWLNFLAWLELNKKRVILGGGIGAGVILLAMIFIYQQSRKEARASEALSEIRAPFSPAAPTPPGLIEAYLKFVHEHRGTKAAGRALLQAAGLLFTEAKYAEAQTHFEQFLRDHPSSPWLGSATLGVAASLEAQGKTKEAFEKYDELRKRLPNDPVIDEAKLALGRLYEADKKNEEAFKLYDELTKANPYSGIGAEAGLRREDLLEKFPELAKLQTPPPSAFPTNVSSAIATNFPRAATNLTSIVVTNLRGTSAPVVPKTNAASSAPGPNVPATSPPPADTPVPPASNPTPAPKP